MGKLETYIKETRGELKHVSWPTRRQAIVYTAVVIGLSLAAAVYLGVFDWILTKLIGAIV